MSSALFAPRLRWLMTGAAFLSTAVPSLAQGQPEEIIVTGRIERVPDDVRTLSQAVSYADLDLSTAAGKSELQRRVTLTARYLCEKLGEPNTSVGAAPSCRDDASRGAMQRVGTVEAKFAPRGTTWVRGPAWRPPYPPEWEKTYPK